MTERRYLYTFENLIIMETDNLVTWRICRRKKNGCILLTAAGLALGYVFYGRFAARVFQPDDTRKTPAEVNSDGVDYVEMPTWKVFLVQLLNIAGTGPIFGALMGAVFGPIVFLWIVFGCVLGGAVHDYFTGMISLRMNGTTIVDIVGSSLGVPAKHVLRFFAVLMLILAGTVFVTSPAKLLAMLTPGILNKNFWVVVILIYYVLATLLPIAHIIGRFYPIFSNFLILMILMLAVGMFARGYTLPDVTLSNLHPDGLSPWPYMFITVACGAVSGFHATQSPLMACCIKMESDGRRVFYGAMITE